MIKDGQIFMIVFRPIGNSVKRVTTSSSCRADEASYTIGGEGIIVVGEISLMRPPPLDLAFFDPSKTTKAPPTFTHLASMYA